MKYAMYKVLAFISFFSLSSFVVALPNPDTHGWIYYAALHEAGFYKGAEFYRKDYPNKDMWSDVYLNRIANARYDAIDRPMVASIESALVELAAKEGLKIKSKGVHTNGVLTVAFKPSVANNILDFTISGIGLSGYGKFEKSWYAEGYVRINVSNITVKGRYDYYNGVVNVTSLNAPISAEVDVDLDIPIIGDILDPIIDNYVDDLVVESMPTNLGELFNGGEGYNYAVVGIEDYIPLNKFLYQGVDYGAKIRNELSKGSLINDNFSISIGEIVVHKQLLAITLGNFTYKRWATGGKRVCSLALDPDCMPY